MIYGRIKIFKQTNQNYLETNILQNYTAVKYVIKWNLNFSDLFKKILLFK